MAVQRDRKPANSILPKYNRLISNLQREDLELLFGYVPGSPNLTPLDDLQSSNAAQFLAIVSY